MRILFLHHGIEDVSSRHRVRIYYPLMAANGITWDEYPKRPRIYQDLPVPFNFKRNYYFRILETAVHSLRAPAYDILFVQRFLFPPRFEWFDNLFRLSRHLVLDVQDAIFCRAGDEEPIYEKRLRRLCDMASLITVSNQFMADWIGLPEKTIIMPSVIDCRSIPERIFNDKKGKVIIGWTGQAYQLDFIRPLFRILANLAKREDVEVWFFTSSIKDHADIYEINRLGIKLIPFSEEKEYETLQQIDIGLMPMPYSVFNLGKFPLKLIKYMSAGASVVCSSVGSNLEIIEEGVHGYFADEPDEWYNKIIKLIHDKDMRVTMGKRSRKKVEECYSIESNWPRLKNALVDMLQQR